MMNAFLQDFRSMQPPADASAPMSCNVLVFVANVKGANYICAAHGGQRGWILVAYLPLTGANATTVINAAFAALTAGRTSKESVVVRADLSDLGVISIPASYTKLEVIGSLRAQAALNTNFIVNAVAAATEIEISGGFIDSNQANQAADMSTIYIHACTYTWVHHIKALCGVRPTAVRGCAIEFDTNCHYSIMSNCDAYGAVNGGYDNLKIISSNFCIIIGNTVRDGNANGNDIQIASCNYCTVANNICADQTQVSSGVRVAHAGQTGSVVIGNVFYNIGFCIVFNGITGGMNNCLAIGNIGRTVGRGIWLLGDAANYPSECSFIGNHFTNSTFTIVVDFGQYNYFAYNTITQEQYASTAISLAAGTVGNKFGPHFIRNKTTLVSDAGTNNQFPSITMQFALFGGGATSENSGIYINAATEYAMAQMFIPYEANGLVTMQVSAHSNVAEADGMQLEVKVNAGDDNEQFNTHTEDVTRTSTTLNFANGDIIRWRWSTAVINAIKGGDDLTVRVIYAPVAGANINTDAWMRTLTVFYL